MERGRREMKYVKVYFGDKKSQLYSYRVTDTQWSKISTGDKVVIDTTDRGYDVVTVALKRDQSYGSEAAKKWVVSVIDDSEYKKKTDVAYLSKRVDELEYKVRRLEKEKVDKETPKAMSYPPSIW